ncbi:methyltransferase domain-containing protein [Sneathiella sp. P13V-1]|uniref:class I SAM-dependent methyltransferase n=1 Tax=Sneathiella sp. P13V-1 TaxID=2697366 RepID=UPI00187B2EEC|nr:class I SAM-dependent methyltransferase [Sneathiella sp. P13V-1]MBE7636551.1 methyltransferase domain-containing protein [Sneathiella sp. P13V-1]
MSDMKISSWVAGAEKWLPETGVALDVAAGKGRHSIFLSNLGLDVVAVDINTSHLDLLPQKNINVVGADLEGEAWPFHLEVYDVILGVNYLHRPLFPAIRNSLKPGGIVIWDTFAIGNGKYGRPSNPNFLLSEGELLKSFEGFQILDFADGFVDGPKPAMRQSIICKKPD